MHDMSAQMRDDLIDLLPAMRAFARSLSGDRSDADDLVQETMVKVWANAGKFTPGTNLRAWVFTILRNNYYSGVRRRRREVDDATGSLTASLTCRPSQESAVALRDLQDALMQLPEEQREALILVGAAGLSYEEAAQISGCALGTIKSRVNRGRTKLLSLMQMDAPTDVFAEDRVLLAALP